MDGCTKEQILQYARSHGLSSNRWVREDIDITSYLPSLHDIESDLADPEDVFKISAPGDAISSEKLALDGPTRTFMQSVCSMQNDESEFDFHACDPSRAMKLKLDEPMLLTDNEADVKSFRKTNERARRLRITCEKAEVDEGKDEGLQWPSGSLKLPAYYTQLAISEKLEIPREALEYLRDTISINHEATDCEDIAEQEIQYRKNPALDPATPPLFPVLPIDEPPESSSSLPEPSFYPEPSHVTSDELHSIEKQIFETESLLPPKNSQRMDEAQMQGRDNQEFPPEDFAQPSSGTALPSSPPLPKARDLKVEVPMTPAITTSPPKFVSFSDIVEHIPSMETGQDQTASDAEYEAFFNEVVEPSAMKAEHELQHEKLQAADSTMRVPVPSMDFTIPEPPWKLALFGKDDGLDIQSLMLPIARMKLHHWPGKQRIDTDVRWTPFPRELATVAMNESLGSEETALKLVDPAQYIGAVDVDSLTWKPEGCRVLDCASEDDEEIDSAPIGTGNDLDSLVRKRKSDLEPDVFPSKAFNTPGYAAKNTRVEKEERDDGISTREGHHGRQADPRQDAEHRQNVFTTNDLSRFMSMQGRESKKPKLSKEKPPTTLSEFENIAERTAGASSLAKEPQVDRPTHEVAAQTQEPLPSLWSGRPMGSRSFIASSTMLSQRSIVRQITRLCPSLDLIERNWRARCYQQVQGLSGSDRPSTIDQDEGDFILSAGLGVICTSLQKIKQMPLPGQGINSFAKQRIAIVAPRHERLVVLVGMTAGKGPVHELQEKDYEALIDLAGFVASLEDEVSIQLAAGEDEEVARWIVGLMESSPCPRTGSEEGMKLLQDETLWELFLRQAGMNTYAAQALLAELKPPDEHFNASKASNELCFGLPAFILMSVQERVQQFESLVEGRKLLLKEEVLFCPVTALAFAERLLIIGVSNNLEVWDYSTSRHQLTLKDVCQRQAIHGIKISEESGPSKLLMVWGGHEPELSYCAAPAHLCGDWILDGAFHPERRARCSRGILVTAHNALIGVECRVVKTQQSRPSKLELNTHLLSEPKRCMLYTAHLALLGSEQIVVTGGTAFGEILIWVHYDGPTFNTSTSANGRVLAFQAHEGSVFGIDISQRMPLVRDKDRLNFIIASCSDDRTIRLWKISFENRKNGYPPNGDDCAGGLTAADSQSKDSSTSHHDAKNFCIAKVMAHLSRIWRVSFLPNAASSTENMRKVDIATAGEDSTSQIFRLENGGSMAPENEQILGMEHIQTQSNHSGKNIWSLAKTRDCEHHLWLATGGADGSCHVEDLGSAVETNSLCVQGDSSCEDVVSEIWNESRDAGQTVQAEELPMQYELNLRSANSRNALANPQSPDDGQKSSAKLGRDRFRTYAFISPESLLMATHNGKLLHGKHSSAVSLKAKIQWSDVGQVRALMSYSLISGVSAAGVAFLAAASGEILCFVERTKRTIQVAQAKAKITALLAQDMTKSPSMKDSGVSDQNRASSQSIALFYTVAGSLQARLAFFQISAEGEMVKVAQSSLLQIDTKSPVIAALVLSLTEEDCILFVGFRSGHVARYVIVGNSKQPLSPSDENHVTHPESSYPHHKDAVTSLVWLNTLSKDTPSGQLTEIYLLTTSRDSTYAIHLHRTHRTIPTHTPDHPTLVHRSSPPFGPNIEGAYLQTQYQQLFPSQAIVLYGFRGTKFVVYNETTRQELLCVEAGGAHRVWAFQPDANRGTSPKRNLFAWTKSSRLNLAVASTPSPTCVKGGGHGREIRACATRPARSSDCADFEKKHILATGAEDTDIRLFCYSSQPRSGGSVELRCVRVVKRHNTGIRSLQWSRDGRYLFSCGGCEEFSVWRIRGLPVVELGAVCQSAMKPQSEIPDLRVMGFEAREIDGVDDAFDRDDREAEGERSAAFWICMGLSNSTVRVSLNVPFKLTLAHPQTDQVQLYRLTLGGGDDNRWDLVWTGVHTSCCLTDTQFLQHSNSSPTNVLSSATDGSISIWSITAQPQDQTSQRASATSPSLSTARFGIHQNSIQALAHVKILSDPQSNPEMSSGGEMYMIFTGGDDNALGITILSVSPTSSTDPGPQSRITRDTMVIPRAHAAAITAVLILPTPASQSTGGKSARHGTHMKWRILTASNDQQVKLWDVSMARPQSLPSTDAVDVSRVKGQRGSFWTGVADVADAKLVEAPSHASSDEAAGVDDGVDGERGLLKEYATVAICGVGIEVRRVPLW